MDVTVKAIEATGTIDAQHRHLLDEPRSFLKGGKLPSN